MGIRAGQQTARENVSGLPPEGQTTGSSQGSALVSLHGHPLISFVNPLIVSLSIQKCQGLRRGKRNRFGYYDID